MTALVAALLLAVPAKDPGRAIARRVQAFYAQTKDFSAGFRQHYTYVAIGRVEESEGVVQVKKPGRVRWDYAKPDRRTLYIEDRTLWIWRPDEQEVQVKRDFGGEQLSSAFTFLWGKGNLLKDFSPRAVPAPDGLPKGDALELTPIKAMPGIEKLLFVVARDGQVLASVVTNPQGDINQIVFTDAKIDQGLSDSLFHFAPPKGAYVQEL
ncbi:MAG: outer membrane lipoprotein carrier protein LolA [Deltaproteobacteria bacterium]|nr:MAG: outer membrane lipoprotein carrier protein LolA [Deltaproteobacteria bacterium]